MVSPTQTESHGWWKAVVVGLIGAAMYLNATGKLPMPWDKAPDDTPETTVVDLVPVFRENQDASEARTHALLAAEIFSGLARGIDFDGTLPEPKLKTAGAAEDIRVLARHYFTRGWRFDEKYPKFGSTVGEYLDKHLDADASVEMTDHVRSKWKEAYLVLERECRRAAKKL